MRDVGVVDRFAGRSCRSRWTANARLGQHLADPVLEAGPAVVGADGDRDPTSGDRGDRGDGGRCRPRRCCRAPCVVVRSARGPSVASTMRRTRSRTSSGEGRRKALRAAGDQAWSSTQAAVVSSATRTVTPRAQGRQGDRATPRAGCDPTVSGFSRRAVERQADRSAVERGRGDRSLDGQEPAQEVAHCAGVGERGEVRVAEVAGCDVDAVGPGTPMPKTAVAARARRRASPRLTGRLQRVAQLGRADDGRRRHQPDRRPAGGPESLDDLVGPGRTGGAGRGAVELDDLGGRGPAGRRWAATSSMVRPTRRRSTPLAAGPPRWAALHARRVRGRASSSSAGTGGRHIHDDRAAEPESRTSSSSSSTRRPAGWTISIRTAYSRRARSRRRPTLKRLTPRRSPTWSWVRLSRW